jgi:hypothetical protein
MFDIEESFSRWRERARMQPGARRALDGENGE